jgi:hypothetical protein
MEKSVAGHAAGTQLLREPCHTTALNAQLFLNKATDMNEFRHFNFYFIVISVISTLPHTQKA